MPPCVMCLFAGKHCPLDNRYPRSYGGCMYLTVKLTTLKRVIDVIVEPVLDISSKT